MAEIDVDQSNVPNERRQLVVNNRRYFCATSRKCSTCTADPDGRPMYVKLKLGTTVSLECATCMTVINLPLDQVPEAHGI